MPAGLQIQRRPEGLSLTFRDDGEEEDSVTILVTLEDAARIANAIQLALVEVN